MEVTQNLKYDAFISYSHHDATWVQGWLFPQLEVAGVSVCIDCRDFEPGAPSVTEIERAVTNSRRVLLVITPEYVASAWAELENILVQTLDPAAHQRRILPLMLKKTELPLRIGALTYLDFSDPEKIESQFKRLVDTVRRAQGSIGRLKILLVENAESWIRFAKAVLADYEFEEARTYREAMAKLVAGTPYDLALVNLNLTQERDASGQEILEYIRDYRPSLPRILLTGEKFHGAIYSNFFEAYQMNEIVSKGDDIAADLRQTVRKLLKPHQIGTREVQQRKDELVSQLKEIFDSQAIRASEGIKALEIYTARLRREINPKQAEELTRPDKEVLLQKRENCKRRYDEKYSKILVAVSLEELDEIERDLKNGW